LRLSKLIEGRTYTYEMILRKQDLVAIGYIPYSSISYTRKFNDYDELSFTTFRYLYSQKDKSQYVNPIWEQLTAGYVVELRIWDSNYVDENTIIDNVSGVKECVFKEYFTISKPDMQANETSDSEKTINCIAQHQMAFKKLKLRGFDDTRKLYDCRLSSSTSSSEEIIYDIVTDVNGYPIENTYTVDNSISTYDPTDNTKGGILNYILKYILPDWKVSYYDAELLRVGQQGRQINVDRNLFTGAIVIGGDDSDGHGTLTQGIATYWKTTGRTIYNNMQTAITSASYSLSAAVDGTVKAQYQIGSAWAKYEISSFLSSDRVWNESNIDSIINEPLNGAKLLTDAESLLVNTQTLIQELYSFQYNFSELNSIDGKDIDYLSQAEAFVYLNDYCNALLYKLIAPLYIYKTASGNVPYRSLQLDGTLVDVFEKLQDSFLCVFGFDNINKTIQIYSRDNEVVNPNSSLIISPDNYMTDISYQADTDQIITRLYATGKDDLWLSGANITGQRFVDNFGYFTSQPSKYFTADSDGNYPLVTALETYASILEHYSDKSNQAITRNDILYVSGNVYEYTTETYNLEQLRNKISELSDRVSVCQSLAKQWSYVYYSDTASSGATQQVSAGAVIAANNELSEIEQDISQYIDFELNATTVRAIYDIDSDSFNTSVGMPGEPIGTQSGFYLYANLYRLQEALVNWQTQFTYENVRDLNDNIIFTTELLNQLRVYIYEEDVSFDNISDDNVLYQYAKDYLEYINQIPITVNIGMVDILSNYQYQREWSLITDVGAKIRVDFRDFDLNMHDTKLKLMEYTHSVSNGQQDLKITLSNAYELRNVYNQMLQNVWYNSYKNTKDIQSYKKYWEDFIKKQDDLLLQGQTISADVNNIVDGLGRPVVNANGLVLSKFGNNAIKSNADGYYVHDRGFSSTKNGTGYTANTVLRPNQIVFDNADVVYDTSPTGYTTFTVKNVGSNSGNATGLPRYYTAPFCSQKLQALDIRNGTNYITTNSNGDPCIYYAEMTMDSSSGNLNGGEYFYYMAKLVPDTTESAVNGYAVQQFTDNTGRLMYYNVNDDGTIDYNTLVYTAPENAELLEQSKVKIYQAILYPTIQVKRTTKASDDHVPDVVFGIGDSNGYGKFTVRKLTDSAQLLYTSRTENGRIRGLEIKDNGIYQIRGNESNIIPFTHLSSTEPTTAEEGDLWIKT